MGEFIITFGEKNPKLVEFSEVNKGKTFLAKFEALEDIRSTRKNAAYWAGIVTDYQNFFHDLGHTLTLDEVHSWLKQNFNFHVMPFGVVGKSTRKLTEDEFKEYMSKCESWLINKKESIYEGYKRDSHNRGV